MKTTVLVMLFTVCISSLVFAQSSYNSINLNCDKIEEINTSPPASLSEFLRGVKIAVYNDSENPSFSQAMEQYLKDLGFNQVYGLPIDEFIMEKSISNYGSLCDITRVDLEYKFDGGYLYGFELIFESFCSDFKDDFGKYTYPRFLMYSNKKFSAGNSFKTNFYNALISCYNKRKGEYNPYFKIKSPQKITCWNESSLKQYFSTKKNVTIEGVYEKTTGSPKFKVALKQINGTYYLIYLSGSSRSDIWSEGEIKAILEPSATGNLYKAYWIMPGKGIKEDFYISFENGIMNVFDNKKNKDVYLKMFPTASSNISPNSGNLPSNLISTGTGFAISSKGYIVTNYHVIEDASSIKIRGINNNFSSSYSATVIASDKNSDLAILKINDSKFTSLGTIPYTISTKTSDVGSSVYVLGYPLLSTMGQEVKVTNGIISSKSGYSGDISSYQISAPIQPGNSGGPLLDTKGNIVGIINAKHKLAENASYAIKSNYLLNLIESLDQPPALQSINSLNGKSFTEQLKVVKNYTYIIEIY